MKTKITLFDKTIFKRNLGKTWIVGAVSVFLLYFTMVLSIMTDVMAAPGAAGGQFEYEVLDCIRCNINQNRDFAIIVSCIMSVLMFSYLQKSKSVSFFHSLPISREGLFITNTVSALVIMYIPNILTALIMFIQLKVMGYSAFGEILVWLLVICVEELFYFSLGSLCMILCGNEIAAVITYLIMIYAPYYVLLFLVSIFRCISYGFECLSDVSVYLTGISPEYLFNNMLMKIERVSVNGQVTVRHEFIGLTSTMLYVLAITAVILVLSVVIYKFRRSERAGDLIAVRWFKPVADFGIDIITALMIISWMIRNIGGTSVQLDSPELKTIFCIDFIITGFAIYIAIRLFFDRKRINLKKLLLSLGFNLLFLFAASASLLFVSDKLEEYIPEPDEIEIVNFQCLPMKGDEFDPVNRYMFKVSDRELIEKIIELNKKASDCKENWLKYNTSRGCVKVVFNYQLKEKSVAGGIEEENLTVMRFFEISEADGFYEICRDMLQPDMIDFMTDNAEVEQLTISSEDYLTLFTFSDISDINDIMNAISEDVRSGRLSFSMADNGTPGIEDEIGQNIYRISCFSKGIGEDGVKENVASEEIYINFTENCTSLMQVLNRPADR